MVPRRSVVPLCLAACVVACADEPSTAPQLDRPDAPLALDLVIPHLTRDLTVTREFRQVSKPGGAARAVLAEHEAEYVGQEDADVVPGIWSPRTSVVFFPGFLQAWGSHDYMANKSRVDVTATVRHERSVIGARTGITEETHLFVPWMRHLVGGVSIATDTECGLSGDGYSDHAAWWEFAPGSSATAFGAARVSSSSTIVSQPTCEPVVTSTTYTGGGGGGGSGGGGWYTCYLWITYDLYSGEILDYDLLFCTEGG